MKTLVLLCALVLGYTAFAQDEEYYETKWVSTAGVTYTGLLIYNDDDDAFMRVNYAIGGEKRVAEFNCTISAMNSEGVEGALVDGTNAKVVIGGASSSYNADNFIHIFKDEETIVYTIDDADLKDANYADKMVKVTYWKEVKTTDFTEAYVAKFFNKGESYYDKLVGYNLTPDERLASVFATKLNTTTPTEAPFVALTNTVYNSSSNYRISDVASTIEDGWTVVVSKQTGYTTQAYYVDQTYPKDWVKGKWDDNYYITSLASIEKGKRWGVVMSKGTGYTSQSWKKNQTFPADWVKEKWDASYAITDVAYGDNDWVVVMSKGTSVTMQAWKTTFDFPKEWIKEKWDDGYTITSVVYGNGVWAVVMSKGTGYGLQSWKRSMEYPKIWIREKWDDGYYVTSVTYGPDGYLVIMNKNAGYTQQGYKYGWDVFPEDYISDKWSGK